MKPGPQKTPSAMLRLRGSRLLEHRTEPEVVPGDFSCPKDLDGYARKFWIEHMPILEKIGVMSAQDLPQFRMLCEAQQDYNDTRGNIDYYLRMKLRAECYKLASHFGMTPSTRSDVPSGKKSEDNPFVKMAGTG